MDFEKNYQVNYYNCDDNLKLSVPSLLRFFEDLAITHSEASGLGFDFYTRNKVAWFLTRWYVKIESLPDFGESVKVITTPKSFNNFYANRDYAVFNQHGRKIITAGTLWVFLDAETLKPKRIPEEVFQGYGLQDNGKKFFTKLEKINPAKNCNQEKEFKILRRDLDYNDHVNNTRFVSYAFELIPAEIQKNYAIEEISVNYLHEAYYDDLIRVELEETANENHVCCLNTIKKDRDVLCRVKSNWKKSNDSC